MLFQAQYQSRPFYFYWQGRSQISLGKIPFLGYINGASAQSWLNCPGTRAYRVILHTHIQWSHFPDSRQKKSKAVHFMNDTERFPSIPHQITALRILRGRGVVSFKSTRLAGFCSHPLLFFPRHTKYTNLNFTQIQSSWSPECIFSSYTSLLQWVPIAVNNLK